MMKVQGTEASIIVGKCTQLKQIWILFCEIFKSTYVFHQILLRLCREKYFVGLATLFEPPSPMALKVTYSSDNCLFKMYFSSLLFLSCHLFLCLSRFFLHSECFKIQFSIFSSLLSFPGTISKGSQSHILSQQSQFIL